jgi:trimethylamine--corrinoid protein Co-methyltransferase
MTEMTTPHASAHASGRTNGRAGGRAARREARTNPLAANLRPVRPGMEGGTYRPLSNAAMDRIHLAVLDALEQIGLADAPPSGVEYLTGAGAILGSDGRLRFPRALIEDTIARARKEIVTPPMTCTCMSTACITARPARRCT